MTLPCEVERRTRPALVLFCALLAPFTVAAASPQPATPTPSGDAAETHDVTAQGVVVRYRAIPWDASLLAALTQRAVRADPHRPHRGSGITSSLPVNQR